MDDTDKKIEELEAETAEMRRRLQSISGTYPGQNTEAADLIASIRGMKPAEAPAPMTRDGYLAPDPYGPPPAPPPAPKPNMLAMNKLAPNPYGQAPPAPPPQPPQQPPGLMPNGLARNPYGPPPGPPQAPPGPPQQPRAMAYPFPWRQGPPRI
jgi:hypothetical protein